MTAAYALAALAIVVAVFFLACAKPVLYTFATAIPRKAVKSPAH